MVVGSSPTGPTILASQAQNNPPRCLALGLAVLDYCYQVESLPAGGGKYFASGMDCVVGGVATNAAIAMRALGADVCLYSRLGADSNGEWILQQLRAKDLDTGFTEQLPGCSSPCSAVCIDNQGERSIVNYRDRQLFAQPPVVNADMLTGVSAVVADTRWPQAVDAVFAMAAEQGIPTVLDLDQNPENHPLIEPADCVIFAQPALQQLSPGVSLSEALLQWSRRYPQKQLAVTCGAEGVLYILAGEVNKLDSYPVKAVNTLGAGDVFHGAFTYALACGQNFRAALQFANAAAALRVSGVADFPSSAQVLQLLQD